MPEYRELFACALTVSRWVEQMHDSDTPLALQKIWADPTEKERCKYRSGHRASKGHVVEIYPEDKFRRGSKSAQKPIFPPAPFSGQRPLRPLSHLVLLSVERTPRSVILDFGPLKFQIHLQTHTMAQVYTRGQWDDEICQVNEMTRGFKIGMAFDFGTCVLAFPTLDKIFTPHWAFSKEELPVRHADVYTNFVGFLKGLVDWMENRWNNDRADMGGLAVNAIRDADTVFGGLGVYSVVEVFFLAGLSVFLTELEVFRAPSRVARLCEAFWMFAHRAHQDMTSLLQPCWHGFILAAEQKQRLRYANWLNVYAKRKTLISARMKALYMDYIDVLQRHDRDYEDVIIRGKDCQLYDVFEPTLIQAALSEKAVNLGHLIFGTDEWTLLSGTSGESMQPGDPLTMTLPRLVPTYLYRAEGQKALWTICPSFPPMLVAPCKENFVGRRSGATAYTMVTGDLKEKETFQYIVTHTMSAARGPLEYCGMARIIRRQGAGRKDPIISVCRQSEQIPETYRNRELAGIRRVGKDRVGHGKRRRGDDGAYCAGGWQSKSTTSKQQNISTNPEEAKENTDINPRPKKRRRSADLKLVAQASMEGLEHDERSTRGRSIPIVAHSGGIV
ncbi:hypothetical protein EVJ58_g7891 [Rhodofomes roseus]|uniref:Uncharacterized protein n=1 Tax=Rhodofomes roseus TaxID=34475 RepID=A0A4Y9Y357_9APHY|nr:hypothetical protein EVJ58_g7891 [Rhodofomes roseus]